MSDAKLDANSYLLKILIQKLEGERPGFTNELISGVEADRAATPANAPGIEHINEIYAQTLKILS